MSEELLSTRARFIEAKKAYSTVDLHDAFEYGMARDEFLRARAEYERLGGRVQRPSSWGLPPMSQLYTAGYGEEDIRAIRNAPKFNLETPHLWDEMYEYAPGFHNPDGLRPIHWGSILPTHAQSNP